MEYHRIILSAVLFVLLVSFQAFGSTIVYSPVLSVTVPPGSHAEVPLTVSITNIDSIYWVWFVDSVDGSIPISWLVADPSTGYISTFSNSDSTTLSISVPIGTPSGTYSGQIFSKAMCSHGYADLGDGVSLEITVPSSCIGGPVVQITSVDPPYLWPPNGRIETVTVTGRIVQPGGCTLSEVGYSIDDEYGEFTGVTTFPVYADGNFEVQIPLAVYRDGGDMDGRHYLITIFAVNEAGTVYGESIDEIVHDQGQR